MRSKWDARRGGSSYGQQTIEKAIESANEVYDPGRSERTRGQKSVESVAEKTDSPAETGRNGPTDSALKESVRPESVPQRVDEKSVTDSDPESVTDSERPFSLPIREFVALPREHREPLLASSDGRAVVGRHSLTLLGALGGHGKTTLFVDLALHLAAGVDYPPFTVPRPVSILVIENEGPEELFAAKLEARLETFTHELKARLDVCIFDWGGFTIADENQRTRLTREIADKGYDLVFGDPLDALGIEGVGSPEDTRRFLALMKETGLNKSTAWWLNTPAQGGDEGGAERDLGAWGGKPDSVFLLRMLADDRTQIRQPKLRWAKRGKGPTLLMAFDAETGVHVPRRGGGGRPRLRGGDLEAARGWSLENREGDRGVRRQGRDRSQRRRGQKVLEEHPDVFDSRTGEAAKEMGRSPQAILWQLRDEPDEAKE